MLEAPLVAQPGAAVVFAVSGALLGDAHSVEVVDQQLGYDLLLSTCERRAEAYEATWVPTVDDEGPYRLRAKVVTAKGTILSESVEMTVVVSDMLARKGVEEVTAQSGDGQIALSWSAMKRVDGYYVYRSTTAGVAQTAENRVAEVTQTSFVDTDVANGTSYYYAVAGYNAHQRSGKVRESALSPEVSAVPAVEDTEAPSVSITSPTAPATYTEEQSVTIVASASDDVAVARVEFYDGGTLLHTATAAPFAYTWNVTAAENGVHHFTAHAFDAAENCATSEALSLTVDIDSADTAPPSVSITSPANDTSYTSGQTVILVATATDDVGVAKVEFYDGAALKRTDLAAPFTHSWTLDSGSNGTHQWTARAYDTSGNSKSSAVRQLTVEILDPPTAPTGVTASAGDSKNTISWNAVAGATSYDLYWATTSGLTTANGNRIAGASRPYLHTGLANGVTYFYIVVARNAAGTSPASAETSGTPQQAPDTTPPNFSGLASATASSSSQVDLAWNAASDDHTATGNIVYDIYQSTSPAVSLTSPSYTTAAGATSHPVTGLNADTTYYFAVRARDGAGNRDGNTTIRQATTQSAASGPPPPFGTTVGVTAVNFSGVPDCDETPWDLHEQYHQYPAVVIVFNQKKT